MDPSERIAWLALAAVHGVGPATFGRLVAAFGGARSVLHAASDGRLGRAAIKVETGRRLPTEVVDRILVAAAAPDAATATLERFGLWTLTPLDPAYPSRFGVLEAAPPVLYGWGDPAALEDHYAVGVVGTRRPTPAGRALAARVARHVAGRGAVVISGLAIGIDGAAHAATVEAEGRTVAVIGAGHDHPGPRAHRALLRRILARGGAVVSELAPHAPASRGTFPRRNRLLSALADAVVVVEAPSRSGAINTGHHALEQGRALFVAPGRPGDPATAGCLRLLRETPARPFVGLAELDEDLAALGIGPVRAGDRPVAAPDPLVDLGAAERSVAVAIARAPSGLERLVAATGLPPGVVGGAVTLLQLRGLARIVDGAVLPAGPLLERG
ncbi:MAG: protecting protein DprA, DNA processing protein [Chloroflexi bacterium CSP1-4]|nr:MAG: protecting protein DprA, DNA processing protein [Chloroflexi bacterium CSP1-4]